MWKEEGFKGYMRGNGVNCLRIVPYSAVQFTTYEQVKKVSHLPHKVPVLPDFLSCSSSFGMVRVSWIPLSDWLAAL